MRKFVNCKKIVLSLVMCMMLLGGVQCVSAATYARINSQNLSLAGGTYKLSARATFDTVGDSRWIYSQESLIFQSGLSPKGSSITSKKTTFNEERNGVYKTVREYKFSVTNVNYVTQSGSTTMTWYFDSVDNKFVSGY